MNNQEKSGGTLYSYFICDKFFEESIYYENKSRIIKNPFKSNNMDDDELERKCGKLIENYFRLGAKELYNFFNMECKIKGRPRNTHTVSLYLLGCHLQEIIEKPLRAFLKEEIDDNEENWIDFRYTWFLSCLSHDIFFFKEEDGFNNLEKSSIDDNILKETLIKERVKNNVYDHEPMHREECFSTYSKQVVGKYFYYRAKESGKMEHGILGGLVLFDRLIKNYEKAWHGYQIERNDASGRKNDFIYKGLNFKKYHKDHFALIADSIIAHNIWICGEGREKIYTQYSLDMLIPPKVEPIKINDNPLLFFLSLLDTIEPTKRFPCDDAKVILESFAINYREENSTIEIKCLKPNLSCEDYFKEGASLGSWLNVKTETTKDSCKIKILY